jgi:hypothetical protein
MRSEQSCFSQPNSAECARSQERQTERQKPSGQAAGENEVAGLQIPPRPDNEVDAASFDSFPCSDPPGYYPSHC